MHIELLFCMSLFSHDIIYVDFLIKLCDAIIASENASGGLATGQPAVRANDTTAPQTSTALQPASTQQGSTYSFIMKLCCRRYDVIEVLLL